MESAHKLLPFKTRPGLKTWAVYDSLPKWRRKRFKKLYHKNKDDDEFGGLPELNEGDKDQQDDAKAENEDEKENEYRDILETDVDFWEYFRQYNSADDIPTERRDRFKESFFPPSGTEEEIEEKYHLSRCVRVFSNDQDTSGFFIALFKRKPIVKSSADNEDEELKSARVDDSSVVPVQAPLKSMMRCDPKDPDIEFIQTYYGLSKDFPLEQIFTFSEGMNKLFLLNKGLSDFLYADQSKQINLIAGGAETFLRNSSKSYSGVDCIFRISQDGVNHVYPFMTKRIFYIPKEEFMYLINNKRIELEHMPDSDFKQAIDKLSCGCFVVVVKLEDEQEVALVMHRHFKHINSMISDLNLHKIKMCLDESPLAAE